MFEKLVAGRLGESPEEIAKSTKDKNSGDTREVLASGSVEGDELYLDATSSGTVTLYRLDLTASGNSASGEYRAFSNGGETWEGLAEAEG